MEFKRTWKVIQIERAWEIRSLPKFLQKRYRAGYSYAAIADEIGCSSATVCRYINQLGFSTRQMAGIAWEAGLAPAIHEKVEI